MKSPLVPSRRLLRYFRPRLDCTCCFATNGEYSAATHEIFPDQQIVSARRQYSTSTRNYSRPQRPQNIDLWASHNNSCKALPPPRSYPPRIPPQPSSARHASHNSQQSSFLRHLLWNQRLSKKQKSSQDSAYNSANYDETSAQLFNLSRALSRSPSGADLKLRCTEFDANGSVTLVAGEFKKSELIAKFGLLPRDLRKIDSSVLPHILVRPSAILINLLHLRVLIQSDRVLVFDAYGSTDSYTQSLFMYDLEGKLRQKPDPRNNSSHLPYELRALEAVLISVTSGLEAEFALVRDPVVHILQELEEDIDREKLRHLLIHSKKLGTFEQKARLVRDAIDDLLEADDDLAAMYLTERKLSGKPRADNEHQEVEMLLEAYHKICDEIVEISGNLISNIRNTEEVVKAILDANRNQLMLLDLKFSVGTLGLAGGTLIAGLYGMNLNNFIEETDWGFTGVSVVCFVFTGIICVYGMRKLRKIQKVRMWGEGLDGFRNRLRTGGRGNWRNEAIESQAQRLNTHKSQGMNVPSSAHGGPVLWPGMEGLGMHKLNTRSEDNDTGASTHRRSNKSSLQGPAMTIHDDVEDVEARMTEERRRIQNEMIHKKAVPGSGKQK